MTLPKNSFRFKHTTKCVYLFIALCFTFTAFSQDDNKTEEWWAPITQKHALKYDTYVLHGDCFIIGEKTLDGEIEKFKDVTVISKGSENYWILKSATASYNPKTTILDIYDCTMEQFKKDSESLEPEKTNKHINYSVNFEKNTATMNTLLPNDEIESAINKMFDESISAGEKLDFDKMKMQVSDKYSSGFISDGKYYQSFDKLFDDYKKNAGGINSQKLTIDNKKITILSGNSVLLTANGQFSATTKSGVIVNGKFAWTIIYKEIDKEWKIIHTHMTNGR